MNLASLVFIHVLSFPKLLRLPKFPFQHNRHHFWSSDRIVDRQDESTFRRQSFPRSSEFDRRHLLRFFGRFLLGRFPDDLASAVDRRHAGHRHPVGGHR